MPFHAPRRVGACCRFAVGDATWQLGPRSAPALAGPGLVQSTSPTEHRAALAELLRWPEGRRFVESLLQGLDHTHASIAIETLELAATRALEAGRLVLLREPREQPKADALPGVATPPAPPSAPPPPAPAPDDDLDLSDKSLLITRCPPELAPRRGPITITYLLRELAGQAVTLSLRSQAYPGELLLERALDAGQTSDGSHDFEWDGTLEAGPQQGELASPTLSPVEVDLRHDGTYNDQSSFEIVPPTVEVLALGDFNFSTDREVMLPAPSIEAEQQGDLADGIALAAGLLVHLRDLGEDRQVLIAGHTDAAGSDEHNLGLSERRADNVQKFLAGDREGWAGHSHEHAEVADGQEVLRWVANRFGWPCDPGAVDNADGPQTSGARDAFRARYEHEFGQAAGSADAFELADWQAFFDMYEQDLAARLALAREDLPSLREHLVFTDPAILGCGEHWPNDGIERPPVCRDNRRVEALVFHPNELPDPIAGDDPPGKSIYEPGAYRWKPITPGPGPHPIEGPCFELALAVDDPRLVPEDAQLRLHGGPYDLRKPFGDAIEETGFFAFHFHGLARGTTYSLDYEPPEGDPVSLFSDADLDAYIEGIGDEQAAIAPIAFALLPLLELPHQAGPDAQLGPMAKADLHHPDERDPGFNAGLDPYKTTEASA